MKIIYIASGAAGMYCGMCLHDNTLAAAMIAAGEDVLLVPTYTPLRTDEANVSKVPPMMYGGINVYLQQISPLFGKLPRFVKRMLDSERLLNLVSRFASSVQAEKLSPLTVSMIQGADGRQKVELDKLTAWLRTERPDVVHLSNAMLVGMAGPIAQATGAPVVCSLSGEDIFLEKLIPPYYEQARKLLREKAHDVAAYTALNRYYADFMIDYMQIDPERVHVIPHGLKLHGHVKRKHRMAGDPVTIGYFARICYEKGLHLLVEAFKKLHERPGLPPLKLVAAGYLGKADRPYLAKLEERLRDWKLHDKFEYRGEPDRDEKIRILQSFDVMSVPAVYRESKGLSILEALANGVPVVQPAHGSYPETIEDTGGGLLFEPENVDDLADKLERLIRDADHRRTLGERGHAAVHARYDDRRMAEQTIALYRRLVEEQAERRARSTGTVVHGDATLR
ncbi:MAG: glycosyltransferase family 4 protein [Planctomycetales bacterium]|nr:glycosyltransferase family 4 protein [Planctomycetales bacterium]MBN8625487.1 glycosyltransferase family 4 protein [Planctomycetota bacterium]